MAEKKMIKVVATQRGYYKQLIEPGQLFEVPEGTSMGRWMKPFETKEDKAARPVKPRRARKVSKVIPQDAETLSEVTEQSIPDTDDWK